jgi:hypothetical protein
LHVFWWSGVERREIMQDDFRLILNDCAGKIVKKKVSASLQSGYDSDSEGRIIKLVDTTDDRVRGNILGDFDRALTWTGMLAHDVYKSQDVKEEPHRTFDFDTEELLGIKEEKNGESS